MCYHVVAYVEYHCTHQVATRRQYVDCNRSNCRLSRFHMSIEHDCESQCAEIMLPDQHLVMTVRREHCNTCQRNQTPSTNGSNGSNGSNGHSERETDEESEDDKENEAGAD